MYASSAAIRSSPSADSYAASASWTAWSAASHISNGDAVGVGVGSAGVAVGVGNAVGAGVGVGVAGAITGVGVGSGVGVGVMTMTSGGRSSFKSRKPPK